MIYKQDSIKNNHEMDYNLDKSLNKYGKNQNQRSNINN